MLRVDPRQRDRLVAIIRNLIDRIGEARMNGWMSEAAGLQTSLQAANGKLASLPSFQAAKTSVADLGLPVIRSSTRTVGD